MPIMDGFEASQKINHFKKTSDIDPNLKILAMTASTLKGDREKCLEAGMDDYISKPAPKADLKRKIYEIITGLPTQIETNNRIPRYDDDILDLKAIEEARDTLQGEYQNMLELYFEDSVMRINEIEKALSNNDIESVILPAHTLKSTSKQMGASKLSQMANDIEAIAKTVHRRANNDNGNIDQTVKKIAKTLSHMSITLSETKKAFKTIAA